MFILMEFVSLVWFGFYYFLNEGTFFRIFLMEFIYIFKIYVYFQNFEPFSLFLLSQKINNKLIQTHI